MTTHTPAERTMSLRVHAESAAAAGTAAENLGRYISDEAPGARVRRIRDDREAQDLGATLLIVLASPAIIALARGVARWFARHPSATVTVECEGKRIELTNVTHRDAVKLARELTATCGDAASTDA